VLTLLAEYPAVEVVGEATNGRDAVDVVRQMRPDLLFLDIQMPDEDGFRVLERLGGDVPPGVVFVTAHDEHALRAFEVHALDYVLKPFGRPRFSAAVSRALERLSALDALSLQRTLASIVEDRRAGSAAAGEWSSDHDDQIGGRPAAPRRIGVRIGSRVVLVDIDAIDWVEASGDYARVHTSSRSYLVTQRMHALERLLEHDDFIRIHRSLLVRLGRVRELHRESDGGGTIVLASGVRLRVARSRWEALQAALRLEAN